MPLSGTIGIAVDIGPEPCRKVGLSLTYPRMGQPRTDSRWLGLLDHLVDSGLCTAEERLGLLQWPGIILYNHSHSFPEPSHAASLPGLVPRWVLARLLHHMKLDCFEDGSWIAKAYFGFRHLTVLMNTA